MIASTTHREINFGDHENLPFDQVNEKDQVNTMAYKAPNGESWKQVRDRAQLFINDKLKQNGTHLIFTHGVIN